MYPLLYQAASKYLWDPLFVSPPLQTPTITRPVLWVRGPSPHGDRVLCQGGPPCKVPFLCWGHVARYDKESPSRVEVSVGWRIFYFGWSANIIHHDWHGSTLLDDVSNGELCQKSVFLEALEIGSMQPSFIWSWQQRLHRWVCAPWRGTDCFPTELCRPVALGILTFSPGQSYFLQYIISAHGTLYAE